jgi:hypothetical protein
MVDVWMLLSMLISKERSKPKENKSILKARSDPRPQRRFIPETYGGQLPRSFFDYL